MNVNPNDKDCYITPSRNDDNPAQGVALCRVACEKVEGKVLFSTTLK
jgi:hypothetical protein